MKNRKSKNRAGFLFYLFIFTILIIPFTSFLDSNNNYSNNNIKPKNSETIYRTTILRPDELVLQSDWDPISVSRINENVIQPNAGNKIYILTVEPSAYIIYSMSDFILPDNSYVSVIDIWVRGQRSMLIDAIPSISYQIGSGTPSLSVQMPFKASLEWRCISYIGLSLSQSDVNDLMVKMSMGPANVRICTIIDTIYMELTYVILPDDDNGDDGNGDGGDDNLFSDIGITEMLVILVVCIVIVIVLICFIINMKNKKRIVNNNKVVRYKT